MDNAKLLGRNQNPISSVHRNAYDSTNGGFAVLASLLVGWAWMACGITSSAVTGVILFGVYEVVKGLVQYILAEYAIDKARKG